MTLRIADMTFDVPSNVANSYKKLSVADRKMLLDDFFDAILDMNDLQAAEEHNRANPETYTLDEIRKELGLA